MAWCKKCKVAGIRLLLKKDYHIDRYVIDVEAEVDSTLSFSENWTNIKDKYVKPKIKFEEMW